MTVSLLPPPEWFLSKLAPPEAPAQQLTLESPTAPPDVPHAPLQARREGWARQGMKRECDKLAALSKGSRTTTLNAVAYRLYRLALAGVLDEQEIASELLTACNANGLIRDKGSEAWARYMEGARGAALDAGPAELPDFNEGGSNGSNDKLTTPPLPPAPDNELEQLRRFVADTGRILATAWKPSTKLTALYLELRKLDGDEQLLDIPAQEVARNIKISPATANNSIKQLSLGGLVERRIENVLMDNQRREVNPRTVDPNNSAYHWEGQSTLFAPPLPADLPDVLPKTAYDSSQQEKAAENLRQARWAAARLQALSCPCCGEKGLHVVCTACGATVAPEGDSSP